MAVSGLWWSGKPAEKYWMELVNVDHWGDELLAPNEGRYQLLRDVQEGDVIFHWVGKNNPRRIPSGMYGASLVAGELHENAGLWEGKPSHTIKLTGYQDFPKPILLTDLKAREAELRLVLDEIKKTGSTPHFPFAFLERTGLKPNQRYLTKWPVALLERVPEITPPWDWDAPIVEVPQELVTQTIPEYRRRYGGRCMDPILRKAIEEAAVSQATRHYQSQGFVVEDVGLTHSYDLRATRASEERHIEVKGSQSAISKIMLTRNEVWHATDFDNTDLVLVEDISWSTNEAKEIETGEGFMTVIPNWRPSPENLEAMSYEYTLD